jgi:hypothetical protein
MLRPAVSSSWLRNLNQENPMTVIHYIGFDVHKKTISYCVKAADGRIVQEGKLAATRPVICQKLPPVRKDIEFWSRRDIASLVVKHHRSLPLARSLRIGKQPA